jgi:type II secretory pathway predicted ATPase ExeA
MRRAPYMSRHVEIPGGSHSTEVLTWFGLREDPFAPDPDARFYFPLPAFEKAVEHCVRAIVIQAGMPLIHGAEGTGKSMLAARLRARLAEGASGMTFVTHVIDGSQHSRSSTPALRELSLALGGQRTVPNYRLYDEIERRATRFLETGTCVVVFLERAELFRDDMLRTVLFLWNLVTRDGSQFLVRLVAFGRPDYLRTLEKTKYANIRSRTVFGAPALRPFTEEELAAVLRHRVIAAGGPDDLLAEETVLRLHEATGGNPGLALAEAARALTRAHSARATVVAPGFVGGAEARAG